MLPSTMLHRMLYPVLATLTILAWSPLSAAVAMADGAEAPAAAGESSLTAPTPAGQALLDLTNADRASNGLAPLQFDPQLLPIARARAVSQLGRQTLSHYDADGQLVFVQLLQQAQIGYAVAGENLAESTTNDNGTPQVIEQALMNSPLHRKNILDERFNSVAIGTATDASGQIAYAEIFRG